MHPVLQRIAIVTVISLATLAPGFDVQNLRPLPLFTNGFMLPSENLLNAGALELQYFFHWTKQPLEFRVSGSANNIDEIVNNWTYSNLRATYGLFDNLSLSMDVPINWYNDLRPSAAVAKADNPSLGDIELSMHWRLRTFAQGQRKHYLMLMPSLTLPTGDPQEFTGHSNVTASLRMAGVVVLNSRHALRSMVGVRLRERERFANLHLNHEVLAGLGYTQRVWVAQQLDWLSEVYASTTTRRFVTEEVSSPVEFITGLKKTFPKIDLAVAGGAGAGINNGYGAPDFRVFLGVAKQFGLKEKPAVAPSVAALEILVKNQAGEDLLASIRVSRADQSMVSQDQVTRIKQELAPELYDFRVEAEGYYPKRGQAKVVAGYLTQVPVVLKPKFATGKLEQVGQVLFDLNKASIKQESLPALSEVYSILVRYPEIKSVQVEAHTDSLSSDVYNLTLSNARAKSVMEHLTQQGVEAARLTHKGLGEAQPVADNSTREGRAKNRRVEFVILESLSEDVEVLYYEPSELYNLELDQERKRH